MITEPATVVKIEKDAIWVRARQKTACGSCSAEKGCGQNLLAEWASKQTLLKIDIRGQDSSAFRLNDQVLVGVPENVVVKGSLQLYFLPLGTLIVGAALGHYLFGDDLGTAIAAILGLLLGGYLAARRSRIFRGESDFKPVLMEHNNPL